MDNCYVIGMVGRFTIEKNHEFVMKIAKPLCNKHQDIIFIFVGDGEEIDKIKAISKKSNLDNQIRFLGARQDVASIYQAMDVCIMPSLFEGFPMVALEAICSGMPLILSEQITREFTFSQNVVYLPLKEDNWVRTLSLKPIGHNRGEGSRILKENGYDIRDSVKRLEEIYSMD